jgi:hypothetical protein
VCSGGTTCGGCGAANQACCSGSTCNANLSCISNTCVCGDLGQACCSGTTCNSGYVCGGGNRCVPCGASDQPCCTGGTCNVTLTCAGGTCYSGPPPSMCSTAGVLFCDGFDGTISSSWTVAATDGTLTTDGTHVYRGTQSLRVHVNSPSASTYGQVQLINAGAPLPLNPAYVRFFLYFPSATPAIRIWPLNYQQQTDQYGGSAMAIETNRDLTVGTYRLVTSPSATSTNPLPMDQWVCLEYQIETTTSSGTSFLKLLQAGSVIDDAGSVQILAGEPLTKLYLGFEESLTAGMAAFDYWIDEIAIDNSPIGCSK